MNWVFKSYYTNTSLTKNKRLNARRLVQSKGTISKVFQIMYFIKSFATTCSKYRNFVKKIVIYNVMIYPLVIKMLFVLFKIKAFL